LLLPEYAASLPPFLRKRVTHIFNPAPPVSPGASPARPEEPPLIVCSLGRIAPVKELPLLMRAFARLSTRFPMWELHIWGKDGVEMDLAAQWRLSPARDRIRLRGLTPDPLAAFRRAHVFCIPSRCEGMPLTILEAMSCGLPVVGFADCAGVRALIRDGENGLLAAAREEEALAETLARLMESAALRERLGRGGLETAAAYAPEAVWDQWEALLRRTAACKGRTRMDAFAQDPFASQARLSTAARQEWVLREFGQPLPGSLAWHTKRLRDVWHGLLCGTLPTKRGDYGCFD
jgi:glycosyltransferase involved in cell wall biosynthesis